jgi:hypothetical protein
MIIAIVATTSAVALGLALNASRAQVKGLGRELNKAQFKLRKMEEELFFKRSESAAEKDKAKIWENRADVAERDLQQALSQLFLCTERQAKTREQDRLRKQKYRAKKNASKNVQ